ncbi:MAG: glycosyltransferase family 4 protein [Capsulimonadales bacterium]|nr:glycosyltransferase family 4 protein [Capsulimonadales bacterium]
MDQQVGLKTAALNLERAAGEDATILSEFLPVTYKSDAMIFRVTPLPKNWKGAMAGAHEIRAAMADPSRFDGILWATWAAKLTPDLVRCVPAFLRMDMTPVQMRSMGEQYGYSGLRARLFLGWKERSTRRLYEAARHHFPWSEYVARSLRDDYGVPSEKITVVSPGTDTGMFRPDPARFARADRETIRLLFVGGDFRRKGGDLLIDWMAKQGRGVAGKRVELHLVTRDKVPEAAHMENVIVHHGVSNNSPELIELYRQSDLFVLPTRADCYSLVAMEAMACGVPVLITDIGGISDIVSDGETGFLLRRDDARLMGERLEFLIGNESERRRMSFAARERACSQFDSRICSQRMLRIMKAAI